MKKWLISMLLPVLFLSGCASKESKAFRDDENVRAEIHDTIVQKGQEDYNLKLIPNMGKMKFGFQNALPLIDDEALRVPVRTTNNPEFQFDAYITIDADNSGYRALGEIEIDRRGLHDLGEFLLTSIYQLEHRSKLDKFLQDEKGVSLNSVEVLAKTSVFIKDEKEKEKLIKSMIADYNAGKFDDPSEFADLLTKFMLEDNNYNDKGYLPELHFDIELTYRDIAKGISADEKFEKVISYVHKNETHLPSGKYIFKMNVDDEKNTSLGEYITIDHEG